MGGTRDGVRRSASRSRNDGDRTNGATVKLISSLVAGAILAIAPATSGAATDTFTRTLASGWGTADVGGAWTADSGAGRLLRQRHHRPHQARRRRCESGDLPLGHRGRLGRVHERRARQDADRRQRLALPRAPPPGRQHQQLPPLARFAADGRTFVSGLARRQRHRGRDRRRGRRPRRQLPHRLQAARPADGHQSDDDQDQGLESAASPQPGTTPPPTAPARRSPAGPDSAATPRVARATPRSW